MNILNFFKKDSKSKGFAKMETLDKSQIKNIIGGFDGVISDDTTIIDDGTVTTTDGQVVRSKSNIRNN